MGKFTQIDAAMQMAKSIARSWFRGDPEKIGDAMSKAWEFSQTASDRATPGTIAYNAVRHVMAGRTFQGESVRSIDCPPKPRSHNGLRFALDWEHLASMRDNPAELVAAKLDTRAWFATLTNRERRICKLSIFGYANRDIARLVGTSAGRISQIRLELKAKWEVFSS